MIAFVILQVPGFSAHRIYLRLSCFLEFTLDYEELAARGMLT